VFRLVSIPDAPVFAIRSISNPNAYLRLAGAEVTPFRGNGSGSANWQYYASATQPEWTAGNFEVFYISGAPN
jgi:hypothetical protein